MSTMDLLHMNLNMGPAGPYSSQENQNRTNTQAAKYGYYGDRSFPNSQLAHMNPMYRPGYQNTGNSYTEGRYSKIFYIYYNFSVRY